jgi:peptidoglycan-associated lipoprotein
MFKNKSLALLLVVLAMASCTSLRKNSDNSKEIAAQKEAAANIKVFSVPAEEIKKSEATPHVVYFDTNSAQLTEASVATLSKKVLPEIDAAKTKRVVVEAHCDERGSKAYNQKLSEKRALAVKNYLVNNGAKNVKIKTIGYGKTKPVALGHDEDSWSKNRRAITIVIKR